MIRFSLILALFAFFSSLATQERIILDHTTSKLDIGKSLFYYEDKTDKVSFEQVKSFSFQDNFIPNNSESVNFGYSPHAYWFRFDIENFDRQAKEWFLEIAYANLDTVEVYSFVNDGWIKKEYGDTFPFSQREIFSRFFVLPIDLLPDKNYRFFIKVKTSTVVIVPLAIHRTSSYIESSSKLENWYALFYGAMAVMILYNGFIYIAFKSKSYLLYCLATLFTLLFYISFNGHGFQYLWPKSVWWQNHCVPIFTALAWFFMIYFASRFLELKKNFIIIYRISLVLRILFFIGFSILFISVSYSVAIQNILAICSALFIFFSGIISFWKGNRSARYFIVAWFTFLMGVILFTLYIINFIESNFFTVHTIQIGSLLELILLSFALADRYQIIQEDSNRVQKELLETERKVNETLEMKVNERTTELNESLRIIKNDLVMAQKIQSVTLTGNLNQDEKLEIVVRYMAMSEVGGDYYCVDKLDDNVTRIFLADATGHGVQAALIMMAIQGIYDSLKKYALPVNEIMDIFNNEYVRRYGLLNSFLTCVIVDIDTVNNKLVYCSAGHPAGIIIRENNEIQLMKNTGGLIGITRKDGYGIMEYSFTQLDRLFIFTDGIFEQFLGEEEFGEERLYKILIKNERVNISNLLDQVISDLEVFLGDTGKQDDITLIGIGYKVDV